VTPAGRELWHDLGFEEVLVLRAALASFAIAVAVLAPPAAATWCEEQIGADPTVVACDAADDPAYLSDDAPPVDPLRRWETVDTGFGFDGWEFPGSGIRELTSLTVPQIETGDLAWLLASDVATFARAQRSAGIGPGDVVRASFAVGNMVAGARVGVSLAGEPGCEAGQALVVELYGLSPRSIRVSDAARDDVLIGQWPSGYADLRVVRGDATAYTATLSAQGTDDVVFAGELAAESISGICLRVDNSESEIGNTLLGTFNRLLVQQVPEPDFGAAAAAVALACARALRRRAGSNRENS
jgi:hypothetical protein